MDKMKNSSSQVPPGFRFHPTDEELVDYYLRKKVASRRIDLDVIKEIDLYKIEPWDLQEKCGIGAEEQHEWYFFSHKDKKYPTGTRTNRATFAGFWKATGRDKPIYSKHSLIGMRKTLVFYTGRAPNGQKSDWIMHEYRLETNESINNNNCQEEGWVVCRVFKKRVIAIRRPITEHEYSSFWVDDQLASGVGTPSPHHHGQQCKQEIELTFLHFPQLESPSLNYYISQGSSSTSQEADQPTDQYSLQTKTAESDYNPGHEQSAADQVTDWRVLDKFVASQLSQGGGVSMLD